MACAMREPRSRVMTRPPCRIRSEEACRSISKRSGGGQRTHAQTCYACVLNHHPPQPPVDSFTLFQRFASPDGRRCLLLIATVTGIGLQWRGTTSELRLRQALAAGHRALLGLPTPRGGTGAARDLRRPAAAHLRHQRHRRGARAARPATAGCGEFCYFWTFALTTQAFIQPHLSLGPAMWCSGRSRARMGSSSPARCTTWRC